MSENNLNWQEYEAVTKYIYETLGKEFGVKVEGYGRTCKVKGKSGVFHQIDVLTSQADGMCQVRTAIECKYVNKKITKDTVMKVLGVINDAQIEKGIIVSRSGFTKDAADYAREYSIGIVELREAHEKDFEGGSKEFHFADLFLNLKIVRTRPEISNIEIGNNQNLEIKDEWSYYDYAVILKDRTKIPLINYVNEFRNEVNRQNKKNEKITKNYEIPNAILFNRLTTASNQINEITFTGQLTEADLSKNISYKLVDQVWLIMKSIFEERVFTFSESGLIVERKSN